MFAPAEVRRAVAVSARAASRDSAASATAKRPRAKRSGFRGLDFGRDDTYVAASAQLAAGPLHRGHRAAIPRREALILQAALNHPWLLHDHIEELAAAEFRHVDTQKLKGALIDVFAHHFAEDFAKDAIHDADAARSEQAAALAAELASVVSAISSSESNAPSPRRRSGAPGQMPLPPMFC